MLPVFQVSGSRFSASDFMKNSDRGRLMVDAVSWRTLGWNPSGPVDFVGLSFFNFFSTISAVISRLLMGSPGCPNFPW